MTGVKQVRDLAGNVVSVIDSEAPDHTHPLSDISDYDPEHEHELADITDYEAPDASAGIAVVFDAPEADDQIDIVVPFACTITGVTLLADAAGDIVIDIWKDTYANFPPVNGDSITASAPPTLSSAAKSQDTTLTGWTTSLAAGDILRFNVDSAATVARVTLALALTRV